MLENTKINQKLKEVVYAISSILKKEDDSNFLNELVFHVYNVRAKLLKERVEKYGMSVDLTQTIDVPLKKSSFEELSLFSCMDSECIIMSSYVPMPSTIRNSDNLPYTAVTLANGLSLEHINPETLPLIVYSKYTGGMARYMLVNNYLAIVLPKGANLLKWVRIKDIFEYPNLLSSKQFGFENCINCGISLDDIFPMPADMIDTLIDMIVVKYLNGQKQGQFEDRTEVDANKTI